MTPKQHKLASLAECLTNAGGGLLVSWCITYWVLPVWGFDYTVREASEITMVFFAASLLRLYLVRRFFTSRFRERSDNGPP